jgi:hypothetical protein
MVKNDINEYYVGEVYVSNPFGNLLMPPIKEQIEESKKRERLQFSGAINLGFHACYTDFDIRRHYDGFLTLFHKVDNEVISLHDGVTYESDGIDFYKNLRPLIDCLPKTDYLPKNELSNEEALKLFGILFGNTWFTDLRVFYPLYANPHKMEDYCVCNLNLYNGHKVGNKINDKYEHANIIEQYLIFKSGAKSGSFYGVNDASDNPIIHDYACYKCLFVKNNDMLLNLNDNQFYNKGIMQKEHMHHTDVMCGETFYDWMIPFEEYLDSNNQTYDKKDITIRKSLTLFKKS